MLNTTARWVDQIARLFLKHGSQHYGENCTQYEHMAQCAWWAIKKGYDDNMILTAFLHDIGHLLASEQQLSERDHLGYAQHDTLGAQWLREQGLPESICTPIELHVKAKRYLVTVQADYAAGLSDASRRTLAQQGGRFSLLECKAFENLPFFDRAIQLRQLDDLGKADDFNLPPLSSWLARLEKF